jgi:hypothetical protein
MERLHEAMMLYARRFILAALVLAVWSATLLLAGAAQACPGAGGLAAPAPGVALNRAQPMAAAAALWTDEAKAAAGPMQGYHAPARTDGKGCVNGCCVACSLAVLAQMPSGLGRELTASRHILPRLDGVELADPGPGLRPPA